MNEYRLNEYEKNQVAEMLNAKESKTIIPAKIFPIIVVVTFILKFVFWYMDETGFWADFFNILFVFAIVFGLTLYILFKIMGVLDSRPDNRVIREFEKGKYKCKIAKSIEFYHDDYKKYNMVRFQTEEGLIDESIFFGYGAPEVVVLFFKKGLKRAFSFENLNIAEQLEKDLSGDMIPNINLNDMMHQDIRTKYQANIEKLTYEEKNRGEQHGSTRIVFYQEITPPQMYKNVMDNTAFVYRNRVSEEGSKVIKDLKGVGGQRRIGMAVQWIGLLTVILFVVYIFNFKSLDWNENFKQALALIIFFMGPLLIVVGGSIRVYGRKYLIEYLSVWNPVAGSPMEINRLSNGQLVILSYAARDKSCSTYLSALNMNDTEWKESGYIRGIFERAEIPSYINYMYVIDSVKSCTKTKNGLMIESSGRYYGKRMAYIKRYRHKGSSDSIEVYCVFTETQITYRKEEILDIFTDMEQLEMVLNTYSDYILGMDAFTPLYK